MGLSNLGRVASVRLSSRRMPCAASVAWRRRALSSPRRSEEHTSELQSLMRISYAVFCLKKKNILTNKRKHNISQLHSFISSYRYTEKIENIHNSSYNVT